VLAAVPRGVPYSARGGGPLAGFEDVDGGPDIVIWAVGRSRQAACQWPPSGWAPRLVVDLNYTEDSPGLEYAQRLGVAYQSGLNMFKTQAQRQREFWDGG